MRRKSSDAPTRIKSWDDVIFDPAQFVQDMEELVDHYKGKKKLTLRTFRVVRPAPQFTPSQILKLRRQQKLSRSRMARILNVPDATVGKWESGERKPSGAAARLLQIMQAQPETLLRMVPV
ncbi:MAG: helix-turn-helix domain-containing protein [Verrucomicrobia bacterium]|nr:helix-turn-helix domain-containing protein [Verrucomicrobiota bacterium]